MSTFHFNARNEAKLTEIFCRYPTKRAAMLPVLWLVQEQEGWVSLPAMESVAKLLEVTAADVQEVVTFYTMLNRRPIGKHHIQICNNLCCRLRNADWLVEYVQQEIGCVVGETSPDGKFHLSTVECLASCGTAPMMQIDCDYYENLTAEKVHAILEKLRRT